MVKQAFFYTFLCSRKKRLEAPKKGLCEARKPDKVDDGTFYCRARQGEGMEEIRGWLNKRRVEPWREFFSRYPLNKSGAKL